MQWRQVEKFCPGFFIHTHRFPLLLAEHSHPNVSIRVLSYGVFLMQLQQEQIRHQVVQLLLAQGSAGVPTIQK
ncbi:uncharacterized [Tachysurus ichikawai]